MKSRRGNLWSTTAFGKCEIASGTGVTSQWVVNSLRGDYLFIDLSQCFFQLYIAGIERFPDNRAFHSELFQHLEVQYR